MISKKKEMQYFQILFQSELAGNFDRYILQISKKLIEKAEVLELGIRLGIDSGTIDLEFVKCQTDSTEATRHILHKWLQMQEGYEGARLSLGKALVTCKQNLIAKTILNYP